MSVVNIPGVEYLFPGKILVIPPLSLGDLEQLLDRINNFMVNGGMNKEGIATVIDATHAALLRNYPEMTRLDVGALVDLSNFRDVLSAVMGASGLEPMQVTDSGEALAPSTGASSTLT